VKSAYKKIISLFALCLIIVTIHSCSPKQQETTETKSSSNKPRDDGWDNPPLHALAVINGAVTLSASDVTLTYTITCEDPNDVIQCFHIFYRPADHSISAGQAQANLCALTVDSTVTFTCDAGSSGQFVSILPSCNIPEKGVNVQAPNASMGFVLCP